jgi:hypothetical protein
METIKDISPNHTQVPNIYLDMYMADLTHAEWKCLCYIARRTFGFQKRTDSIATSQFENGITDSKGNILDKGTGLTNKPIIKALESLVKMGLISVVKDNPGITKSYKINTKILTYGKNPQVKQKQPMDLLHNTYGLTPQEPMDLLHIQKKEKESIQKKELVEDKPLHKLIDESKDSIKINEIIKEFENVNPACKRMYGNTTQRQAVTDLIDTYTYDKVVNVIRFLPKSNNVCFWKATTPKQLWDNWANIQSEITSKFNKEATKKNNVAF